jgi:hypothetical protein
MGILALLSMILFLVVKTYQVTTPKKTVNSSNENKG